MGLAHCLSIHSFIHLAKTAVVSTHPARPPPSCPAPPSLPPPAFVRDLTSTCEMARTGYGRCQSGGEGWDKGLENFWGKEKNHRQLTGNREREREKSNGKRKTKMKRIPYQRPLHTLVLLFPLLFNPTPWSSSLLLWVPGCTGDVCYCPLSM